MQNKLKGTPVVPLLVAQAQENNNHSLSFIPFNFKELSADSFPNVPHARGYDIQHTIDTMR